MSHIECLWQESLSTNCLLRIFLVFLLPPVILCAVLVRVNPRKPDAHSRPTNGTTSGKPAKEQVVPRLPEPTQSDMTSFLSPESAKHIPVTPTSRQPETPRSARFDIVAAYNQFLKDEEISMPVAAILALTEQIANSRAATMYELVEALKQGASSLKRSTPNPVSLTAGCDLFIRYVTTARQDYSADFSAHKDELVRQGREYAENNSHACREKIAQLTEGFLKDEVVILTHSYSRVVMAALLHANKRKRISAYVTEARPRGLGVKTHEVLTRAGIPCTIILDTAIAYIMDRIDIVLVGSEAVVESGGLINAVGTFGLASIAKMEGKPFYALAESYKFLRFFPLSQYDLPTHNSSPLALPSHRPSPTSATVPATPSAPVPATTSAYSMTSEQISKNPDIDYTKPDLITLVFSDVGVLTPDGVSSFLVGVFAD